MNKKGAKESSSSKANPKYLICKVNSFFQYKKYLNREG